MNLDISVRMLVETIRAGFLNRVRTYRFIITLAFIIMLCYALIPPADALYTTYALYNNYNTPYRGVYNSAWVGTIMALQTTIWLSLFGFYIINDAIKRDEDTKVGEILATTQLRNPIYFLAKFLTNIAILGAMSCIILIMSGFLQIFRGEVYHLDLVSLIVPFVILIIPIIFFVSGAALFFETFPVLRGTWSNIAWFFFWMFLMVTILIYDPFITWLSSSIRAAAHSQYPNIIFPNANFGLNPISLPTRFFLWNDVSSLWRFDIIIFRFFWYISALILAFTAIFFFHRFDPSVDRGFSIKHKISSLLATETPVTPETEDEQQITLTTVERTVKPV
ncbi:MAG: hypothetical protein JSW11_02080, partial [Candidatus Heimdallarchaeota archaeon]